MTTSHARSGLPSLDRAEELLLDALADRSRLDEAGFDSLCARHPEHAAQLRVVYASYRTVESSLRGAAAAAAVSEDVTSRAAGRFRVLGELGRGGMSIVYAAWDAKLRRKVALKTLLPFAAEGPVAAARLQRRRARLTHEAQVLAQLDHPGIVPVYDVVHDDDGAAYVAMLRVRGVDLREIYRRAWSEESEWSLARVVGVLQRVCEALSYAHGKGVLHRDLKPANVMVGAYGEAYVMDWGLARTGAVELAKQDAASPRGDPSPSSDGSLSLVVTDRDDSDSAAALHTQRGDVLGTPSYMSPEQAAGELERIDERSDVYSVGAMLYELLARTAPYVRPGEASTSTQILSALREAPPAPLVTLAPDAPAELIAIADKAMSRAPEQRYASMAELADDLRAFLEGRVVRAYRTGAWAEARKWIGRHRAVVGVLAALLVTLIAALVTFAVLLRESERSRTRMQAAQVDAQRRANASGGYATSTRPCMTFVDEFEGPEIHRRWTVGSRADLVTQRDGALVLHSEADGQQATGVDLDRFQQVIYGDFDVRVHFRVEGFDTPSEPRAERQVMLRAFIASSDLPLADVSRCAERDPPAFVPSEQSYRALTHSDEGPRFLPETCAAADDRSGALRITRVGDRVSTYYWKDGWQRLHEETGSREPATLALQARTFYAGEPFDFVVERVELFTDELSMLEPISELHIDFAGPGIDEYLTVSARAGIAAPLDGRLYLETFEGGGSVRVMLHMLHWKISGDFEWQAQIELHELPAPPEQSSELRIEMHTISDVVHGVVAFRATPLGRKLVAFNHRERVERPLDARSVRVRFVRHGSELETWIETNGEWQRLLVRTGLTPKTELSFSIRLESPEGAPGALVSLDDLSVTGLSER